MIVSLNGWPGVGKLTVANYLVQRIGGRLLDNHTIYNVAFSLCDFGTPEFYQTVREVRDIAFARVIALPRDIFVTTTNAYSDTPFGRENWAAIRALADKRGSTLFIVVLHCSIDENARRLQSSERVRLRKLRDPAALAACREGRALLEDGGDHLLRLDVTEMEPAACADRIATWLEQHLSI